MATRLDVVNDCLAIMGETPLNTLLETHAFKGAALSLLDAKNASMQSRGGQGWWFNTEQVKLTPNPQDSRIYLPGDTASVVVLCQRPQLTQRGRVLYDLTNGTDIFPAGTVYPAKLIRLIDFESVPSSVAEFIRATVVLRFQNDYDGDQTKTRNLSADLDRLRADAMSEHMRNRKVNLLDNSPGLARIRNIVRQGGARY